MQRKKTAFKLLLVQLYFKIRLRRKELSKLYLCYFYTYLYAAAAAKSLQSFLTLCNPIDSSPPGSPVPGILQARTLE